MLTWSKGEKAEKGEAEYLWRKEFEPKNFDRVLKWILPKEGTIIVGGKAVDISALETKVPAGQTCMVRQVTVWFVNS